VEIIFDDSVITPDQIMDIFFTLHDPTQLNRQGNDIGTQYRSSMFYRDENEKEYFAEQIERAKEIWGNSVVTTLEPLTTFWPAEDYHQDFFAKNPNQGYCVAVVAPKVAKVKKNFQNLLK
jgi:peptide-methionine (S)-S-oxide reductase